MSALTFGDEVGAALREGRPVVALESTIIAHGLPRPRNRAAAAEFEQILRDAGVTPATIAVLDGVPWIGLDDAGLDRVAGVDGHHDAERGYRADRTTEPELAKASVRDLPVLAARGGSAATTVAATAHLAARAGIRVFATGGLGGVHRGASESFDESADLGVLAQTPVVVVSAGVKSVLDIGATLERLETLGVPVLGYRTSEFPAFWLRASGFPIEWRIEEPAEAADVLRRAGELGLPGGVLVANPVPDGEAWDAAEHDRALGTALAEADARGLRGKEVTPFLLGRIVELSGGRSLEVNLALARNNVRLAARIARAFADDGGHRT